MTAMEDGVLPAGVGTVTVVSTPDLGSIENAETLSDCALAAKRYFPVGSTVMEAGVSPVAVGAPVGDRAPVVASTASVQMFPVPTFETYKNLPPGSWASAVGKVPHAGTSFPSGVSSPLEGLIEKTVSV